MSDPTLLTAAIDAATEGSRPRFAALLGLAESQVTRWLHGTRPLPRDVRRTCEAILSDPTAVVAAYRVAAARALTGSAPG